MGRLHYLKPRFSMRWQYASMAVWPREWIEHGEPQRGYRWFLRLMGFERHQVVRVKGSWWVITAVIKED